MFIKTLINIFQITDFNKVISHINKSKMNLLLLLVHHGFQIKKQS